MFMKRFYYQDNVYTENQLQRKFGVSHLGGSYPVIKGVDPDYSDLYRYPTQDRTYKYDEESTAYIEDVVYADRFLIDVQTLTTDRVKQQAQEATKQCCAGIDPVLLNQSAPEQFTDIKNHLSTIATELHDKLQAIAAATTVEEIKTVVDTPFSSHK